MHRAGLVGAHLIYRASRLARRLPPPLAAPLLRLLLAVQAVALTVALLADHDADATTAGLLRAIACSPHAPARARAACWRRMLVR